MNREEILEDVYFLMNVAGTASRGLLARYRGIVEACMMNERNPCLKEDVIRLSNNGLYTGQIARALGISEFQVVQILNIDGAQRFNEQHAKQRELWRNYA